MISTGISDVHIVEDEEALELIDSDPTTPDTSITDGDMDNTSATHSPSVRSTVERASPDPVLRPAKNGPKIGKRASLPHPLTHLLVLLTFPDAVCLCHRRLSTCGGVYGVIFQMTDFLTHLSNACSVIT